MQRDEEAPPEVRPYHPTPEKTFFERFEIRSWTFYVSVIDIVFFVWTIVVVIALKLMYVTEDMDEKAQEPYSFDCVLYYFGAKHAPSIRYRYQFHRLLMPALLHGSPMHIIGNLVVQIYYGFTQEKYFGLKRVALVYILGALGGALFSCIFFKDQIAVGASAAIFALLGLELVYFFVCFPRIDKKRIIVFFFVAPTIFLSFFDSEPNVDIAGHAGGLITGILLGIAFAFEDSKLSNVARNFFTWAFYTLTGLFLVACLVTIYTMELEDKRICPEQ